jgi:hypothetical protein
MKSPMAALCIVSISTTLDEDLSNNDLEVPNNLGKTIIDQCFKISGTIEGLECLQGCI